MTRIHKFKTVSEVLDKAIFGNWGHKYPTKLPSKDDIIDFKKRFERCLDLDKLYKAAKNHWLDTSFAPDVKPIKVMGLYQRYFGTLKKAEGINYSEHSRVMGAVCDREIAQIKRVLRIIESLPSDEKESLHGETKARMGQIDIKTNGSLSSNLPKGGVETMGNSIYKRELCWTWASRDKDPEFLTVFPKSFWAMIFGDKND